MTPHRQSISDYIGVISCRLDALGPQVDETVSPEEISIRSYALAMVTFLDILDPIERKQVYDRCIELGALTIPRAGYLNALYASQEGLHG